MLLKVRAQSAPHHLKRDQPSWDLHFLGDGVNPPLQKPLGSSGASPLLFGEFRIQLCAFVFLEDISGELPPYEETYLSVPMDAPMREAYRELEDDMRKALKAHRGIGRF
jgi:hypothetical protein